MGIVLIPVYLIAGIVWVISILFFTQQYSKDRMLSYWSFPLGILIMAIIYGAFLTYLSCSESVNNLEHLLALPLIHIIIPGLFGFGGLLISKDYPKANLLGYAFSISCILSPIPFILFPSLFSPETFILVEISD